MFLPNSHSLTSFMSGSDSKSAGAWKSNGNMFAQTAKTSWVQTTVYIFSSLFLITFANTISSNSPWQPSCNRSALLTPKSRIYTLSRSSSAQRTKLKNHFAPKKLSQNAKWTFFFFADFFLPNSLKRSLNLRHTDSRYTRPKTARVSLSWNI